MSATDSRQRWGIVMGVSLVLALAIGILGSRWLTPDCEDGECPSVEAIRSYRPPEPPQIYDADGERAGQLSGPQRTVVGLDSIPEIVRSGYVAVEDRRFRDHGGVDLTGAARAMVRNIRSTEVEEGASTITMQLARNVFGSEVLDWNRWHRKLAEFRLARQMESRLTKDEILELYLNQIYLGDGVYGVETAARHYFGKPVAKVTPREAALLIGLAKNPEGYNPRRNPERAAERVATILDILEREGVITPDVAQQARDEELDLTEVSAREGWGPNAFYLSAVRRELREIVPNPVDRKGMRVYTGLDQRAQAAAVERLVGQIRSVESGRWGSFRHEVGGEDMPRVQGSVSPYLQGAVIAMTPDEGLVTTLVGGRDYAHSEFDRAFQARRQPGSAFKPIVYAAALGRGLRLSQSISTEPVRFAQQGRDDWTPSDHVSGEELSVRDALVYSSNTAAVRIGQRVGTGSVIRQARAMGIEGDLPEYPSLYLGAGEVTPAELTAAYATFVNGGHTVQPHLITHIDDHNGRTVWRRQPDPGRRAIDSRIAFLLLDMMREVTTRGTGWRIGSSGLSYPAAGKTGTTNDSKDVWFVGMTPKLVAGVWLGFDHPQTIVPGSGGGDLAAPVWAGFMQVANRNLGPMRGWEPPSGISRVRVAVGAGFGGFAIPEDCRLPPDVTVRTEYFLTGSEPAEYCPYGSPYYYSDGYGWSGDTVGWARRDSLRRARGDTMGRTVFWRGDEPGDSARLRQREERLRRLDSLRNARSGADRRPAPRDTIRIPTRPRPDTARPDTTRPDTLRPDTLRPDTLRRPSPPAGGTSPPDTLRPGAPR